jgi:hypothetical protein
MLPIAVRHPVIRDHRKSQGNPGVEDLVLIQIPERLVESTNCLDRRPPDDEAARARHRRGPIDESRDERGWSM